jgi:clan AA aspartic protease
MGLTRLRIKIRRDATAKAFKDVEFLVDSGAIHSVVPRPVLRQLGIRPFKKTSFIPADGGSVERDVGTAHFIYKGHEGGAPVIFGEKDDKALLGATTLESLELGLNPLSRDLYPLHMTLMGDTGLWALGPAVPVSKRRRHTNQ